MLMISRFRSVDYGKSELTFKKKSKNILTEFIFDDDSVWLVVTGVVAY